MAMYKTNGFNSTHRPNGMSSCEVEAYYKTLATWELKEITTSFGCYIGQPKIRDLDAAEIPEGSGRYRYVDFVVMPSLSDNIDRVRFRYKSNRFSSTRGPNGMSIYDVELYWRDGKLRMVHGAGEDDDDDIDPDDPEWDMETVVWKAIENIILCAVEEGYAKTDPDAMECDEQGRVKKDPEIVCDWYQDCASDDADDEHSEDSGDDERSEYSEQSEYSEEKDDEETEKAARADERRRETKHEPE